MDPMSGLAGIPLRSVLGWLRGAMGEGRYLGWFGQVSSVRGGLSGFLNIFFFTFFKLSSSWGTSFLPDLPAISLDFLTVQITLVLMRALSVAGTGQGLSWFELHLDILLHEVPPEQMGQEKH